MSSIRSLQNNLNLDSLKQLAENKDIRLDDEIRGKSTKNYGLLGKDVAVLYKKTKSEGTYKVEKREGKRENAGLFVKLALENTLKNSKGVNSEFLGKAFDTILQRSLPKKGDTLRGAALKEIVKESEIAVEMSKVLADKHLKLDHKKLDKELGKLSKDHLLKLMENPLAGGVDVSPEGRLRAMELKNLTAEDAEKGHLSHNPPPDKEHHAEAVSFLRKVFVAKACTSTQDLREPPNLKLAKALILDDIKEEAAKLKGDAKLNEGTIFRGNSEVTLYTAGCSRALGQEWLTSVLQGPMDKISTAVVDNKGNMEIPKGRKYPKAPEGLKILFKRVIEKTPVDVEVSKPFKAVEEAFGDLIKNISGSHEKLPKELCELVKFTHDSILANKGSPSSARNGAIGILLLRLLNPVLVSPQNSPGGCINTQGFAGEKSLANLPQDLQLQTAMKKALQSTNVLLSKMLQALSNGTVMKDYEGLNDIVDSHRGSLDGFFQKVLERGTPSPTLSPPKTVTTTLSTPIKFSDPQEFLKKAFDEIQLKIGKKGDDSTTTFVGGNKNLSMVDDLMKELEGDKI